MKALIILLLIYTQGHSDIVSSKKPIFSDSQTREPANIGDVLIENKDNFRIEAFGESRAKAHKVDELNESKKKTREQKN